MPKMKALLVDDDPTIRLELQPEFEALDYSLDYAPEGILGLKMALDGDYDLILLDINLPGLEGVEVCKRIRARLDTPIIMLSQNADELSKVLLLEIGADDYITKPYAVRELKARVKALMRRFDKQHLAADVPNEFSFRGLKIDFHKRQAALHGKAIEFTTAEFDILALLCSEPGRSFSREELLKMVYGFEASTYSTSITNYINRIRAKIEENPDQPVFILTVRGHGYRFADKEE